MNSPEKNLSEINSYGSMQSVKTSGDSEYETTLRLIAVLPAPVGIEDRVQAGLRAAPGVSSARVLRWPQALRPGAGWMRSSLARTAAAAAIAFAVVGGGWSVVSHNQPARTAGTLAPPPHWSARGSFSSAGAMRTPQTLNRPIAAAPAVRPVAPAAREQRLKRGKSTSAQKTLSPPVARAVSAEN